MIKNKESFFNRLDIREKTLSNKQKFITIKRETELVSIHCGINIGSIYEEKEEKGVAHFIEHMLFKGTKKRDNESLIEEFESLGGEYDAYTDYTSTVYSITALSSEIQNGMELLYDLITNPSFENESIDKEKEVIISELKGYLDDIENYSFIKLNQESFNKSGLRYDGLGTKKSIKSMTKKKIENFYNKYYNPENSCIVVVSPFEHDEIEKILINTFGNWVGELSEKKEIIDEKNKNIVLNSVKSGFEQCAITYLYTFYNLTEKEEMALKILMQKLVASSNSILFRLLREEKGFVYDLSGDMNNDRHAKSLYIYTSLSIENLEESRELIEKTIEDLKNEKIEFDEKSIELMKKNLKTALAGLYESSEDLCSFFLHHLMNEKDLDKVFSDIENLNKIKIKDIYEVARKVFIDPSIHILKNE